MSGPARLSRRRFLLFLGAAGLASWLALRRQPPPRTDAMLQAAWEGLERERVWDAHVHILGSGRDGTGCWINPRALRAAHLGAWLRREAIARALDLPPDADRAYFDRLLAWQRSANPAGRALAMAFDLWVDPDGSERWDRSAFYVPNDYVLQLARSHAEIEACVSVHPYRRDAVERLERAVEAGARAVKWLPAAMGIDPASPRCDAFYAALARLGVPLIAHAGSEYAVPSAGPHEWGNPLRLRRALDAGVRVVVAHCASDGRARDWEAGGKPVAAFDLFLRMLRQEGYRGRLYGDLSAITAVNRAGRPLRTLLRARELHPFLVHGSDFPVPALPWVCSTFLLYVRGYLGWQAHRACAPLRRENPLLYDLAVKRQLRAGKGQGAGLSREVFESARLFAPREEPVA